MVVFEPAVYLKQLEQNIRPPMCAGWNFAKLNSRKLMQVGRITKSNECAGC